MGYSDSDSIKVPAIFNKEKRYAWQLGDLISTGGWLLNATKKGGIVHDSNSKFTIYLTELRDKNELKKVCMLYNHMVCIFI